MPSSVSLYVAVQSFARVPVGPGNDRYFSSFGSMRPRPAPPFSADFVAEVGDLRG